MTHPTLFQEIVAWIAFTVFLTAIFIGLAGGIAKLKGFFNPSMNVQQDVKQLFIGGDPTAPTENLAAATEYLRRHS